MVNSAVTSTCAATTSSSSSEQASVSRRAVATRAPYFHNGMAKDLAAVVDFYYTRFDINLTAQEKRDLVAFLRAL